MAGKRKKRRPDRKQRRLLAVSILLNVGLIPVGIYLHNTMSTGNFYLTLGIAQSVFWLVQYWLVASAKKIREGARVATILERPQGVEEASEDGVSVVPHRETIPDANTMETHEFFTGYQPSPGSPGTSGRQYGG